MATGQIISKLKFKYLKSRVRNLQFLSQSRAIKPFPPKTMPTHPSAATTACTFRSLLLPGCLQEKQSKTLLENSLPILKAGKDSSKGSLLLYLKEQVVVL